MAFLIAGGHRLEYEWVGPPEGRERALVFLHEGLGSSAMWRTFAAALCGRVGRPGLLYDRRGHGRSDALEAPREPRFLHEEALVTLPEVLAECGVQDPVLVGHSDGASIALVHAASAASRALALLLEAPHVIIEPVTASGLRVLAARYQTTDLRERLARYHGDNTESLFRVWSGTWQSPAMEAWSIEDEVRRVTSPVLVIQGEGDEYGTREQPDRIRRLAAGRVETVMLSDCGHVPHRDQREKVLDLMATFLQTVM